MTDEYYMRQAMLQARKARRLSEVPIGCVIVYEDKIIARGYNRRVTDHSTLAHAVGHRLHEPQSGMLRIGAGHDPREGL